MAKIYLPTFFPWGENSKWMIQNKANQNMSILLWPWEPEWFCTWAQNVTWRSHKSNCIINDEELEGYRFGLDIRKNFFMGRVVKPWHRVPKEVVQQHPWKSLKHTWMWHSGTWVSGGHCRAGGVIGMGGLRHIFQFKGFSYYLHEKGVYI